MTGYMDKWMSAADCGNVISTSGRELMLIFAICEGLSKCTHLLRMLCEMNRTLDHISEIISLSFWYSRVTRFERDFLNRMDSI